MASESSPLGTPSASPTCRETSPSLSKAVRISLAVLACAPTTSRHRARGSAQSASRTSTAATRADGQHATSLQVKWMRPASDSQSRWPKRHKVRYSRLPKRRRPPHNRPPARPPPLSKQTPPVARRVHFRRQRQPAPALRRRLHRAVPPQLLKTWCQAWLRVTAKPRSARRCRTRATRKDGEQMHQRPSHWIVAPRRVRQHPPARGTASASLRRRRRQS